MLTETACMTLFSPSPLFPSISKFVSSNNKRTVWWSQKNFMVLPKEGLNKGSRKLKKSKQRNWIVYSRDIRSSASFISLVALTPDGCIILKTKLCGLQWWTERTWVKWWVWKSYASSLCFLFCCVVLELNCTKKVHHSNTAAARPHNNTDTYLYSLCRVVSPE